MTCYKPKIRVEFQNVWKPAKDGHMYKSSKILSSEKYEEFKKINEEEVKIQRIPCGQCIGCRLDYSKEWATRCVLESKNNDSCYFLTLTYDEEHLPIKDEITNEETGEVYFNPGTWTGCLEPKDMQKFMKDLRRYWKYHYNVDNIRFFYCGEYGENFGRPHYHAIIFGLPMPEGELKYQFHNDEYQAIYKSEILEKIWGKGIVTVGEVSFSSCAYVARYICKKIKGKEAEKYYKEQGKIPEFVRMSRRPGIGKTYYESNKTDLFKEDVIYMSTCRGNIVKNKPPRYFDKLYEAEYPDKMEEIKENRKTRGENAENRKMAETTSLIKNQLKSEERTKLLKTKVLTRKLD